MTRVTTDTDGRLLWEPTPEAIERSTLTTYMEWLERRRGLRFEGYHDLWQWSIYDVEAFWASIWDFFEVRAERPYKRVLGRREMPGADWFPGARLSYAEHIFRGRDDATVAIIHESELRARGEVTWGELRAQVAGVAAGLRELGVESGDRVVGYLPNVPETIAIFLACASIGAIWSCCSPDFGIRSVVDRFAQIEPKVLFAADGYRYGGKDFDRRPAIAELQGELPTVGHTVVVPYLDPDVDVSDLENVSTLAGMQREGELTFAQLPFAHPLWVVYSSGTTGLPKAIVHGQGGVLLEHLKVLHLQVDLHAGDRFFWFTTTGWMMWNFVVGGLLTNASIVLYDGSPGAPDMGVLWDLVDRAGITCFGTSASYIAACMKAAVEPAAGRDLSRLGAVGSTGSPLSPEGFDWIYEHLGADTWLFSTSGGTDLCTAFVGGCALLPVYRGELQARALGAAVEAWDEDGSPVIDAVGELVVTEPMPSMPVYFWGDPDGDRYRASYFELFPGVWRHGDWIEITSRGTAVIYGRSDSTINRSGIRMGTSEIYRAVLSLDEIVDALVVDVPRPGTDGWMPLFVVLREGAELNDELRREIAKRVRSQCSPRHVPDEVFSIEAVPRTLSGKVLEVPVKRILMGTPPEQAASRDSLANPAALDYFTEMAARSVQNGV
jgi:acetoacetyl-CoA synthetase